MSETPFRPQNIAASFDSGQEQLRIAKEARQKITQELQQQAPMYPEHIDVRKIRRAAQTRDALRSLGGV